ncbi:MAG: PTS sugar transporter subunit IIA [Myxococcales bacterium]|nr:PTS sugar transporter subunit IIA [Myxococcales bacterium]
MRIVELIQREMVIPKLTATSKFEIIEELAEFLANGHEGIDNDRLVRVLSDREALASTAIGEGVAIPHGKLPDLEQIRACIGRARDGVDFDSMDGKPTHIFIVMVAPENSTGAHLKALARISRVFKDKEFLRRLLEAPGADEMFDALSQEDSKY